MAMQGLAAGGRPSHRGRGLKQRWWRKPPLAASRPSHRGRGLKQLMREAEDLERKSPLSQGARIET